MKFSFPSRVKSNEDGYEVLLDLHSKAIGLFFDSLELDFSNTTWFEANLASVIGAILHKCHEDLNTIEIKGLQDKVRIILTKNKFLASSGFKTEPIASTTAIRYRKFKPTDALSFKNYLETEFFSQSDLPTMSPNLKKRMNESILEIFVNAPYHGRTDAIFSCGQYFPMGKRLDLTIVNLGETIQSNVTKFLKKNMSAADSIDWAVQPGNTTKVGKRA